VSVQSSRGSAHRRPRFYVYYGRVCRCCRVRNSDLKRATRRKRRREIRRRVLTATE